MRAETAAHVEQIKQSLALCDELGHERLASHNRMILAFLDGRAGDADAERVLARIGQ